MSAWTRQQLEEHLIDYLYDELEPGARDAFEAALPSHPEIVAELEAHAGTRVAMRELPPLEPPPGLLSALVATTVAPEEPKRRGVLAWLGGIFAAPALALALVAVVVVGVHLLTEGAPTDAETKVAEAPKVAGGAVEPAVGAVVVAAGGIGGGAAEETLALREAFAPQAARPADAAGALVEGAQGVAEAEAQVFGGAASGGGLGAEAAVVADSAKAMPPAPQAAAASTAGAEVAVRSKAAARRAAGEAKIAAGGGRGGTREDGVGRDEVAQVAELSDYLGVNEAKRTAIKREVAAEVSNAFQPAPTGDAAEKEARSDGDRAAEGSRLSDGEAAATWRRLEASNGAGKWEESAVILAALVKNEGETARVVAARKVIAAGLAAQAAGNAAPAKAVPAAKPVQAPATTPAGSRSGTP